MAEEQFITLYVSGISGSDETGDGSYLNPYKSITYAVEQLPVSESNVDRASLNILELADLSEYTLDKKLLSGRNVIFSSNLPSDIPFILNWHEGDTYDHSGVTFANMLVHEVLHFSPESEGIHEHVFTYGEFVDCTYLGGHEYLYVSSESKKAKVTKGKGKSTTKKLKLTDEEDLNKVVLEIYGLVQSLNLNYKTYIEEYIPAVEKVTQPLDGYLLQFVIKEVGLAVFSTFDVSSLTSGRLVEAVFKQEAGSVLALGGEIFITADNSSSLVKKEYNALLYVSNSILERTRLNPVLTEKDVKAVMTDKNTRTQAKTKVAAKTKVVTKKSKVKEEVLKCYLINSELPVVNKKKSSTKKFEFKVRESLKNNDRHRNSVLSTLINKMSKFNEETDNPIQVVNSIFTAVNDSDVQESVYFANTPDYTVSTGTGFTGFSFEQEEKASEYNSVVDLNGHMSNGSIWWGSLTIDSDYQHVLGDGRYFFLDAENNNLIVTLPPYEEGTPKGRKVTYIRKDTSSHTVKIITPDDSLINGQKALYLNNDGCGCEDQYPGVTVIRHTTGWYISR